MRHWQQNKRGAGHKGSLLVISNLHTSIERQKNSTLWLKTHHNNFPSGCTTLLIFTIYSYQNYATLDTGSKFKTNFWVNSFLQLLKQLFLTNLVAKNTQPSTKAREFVYIKVTHVLENHVRALSHPCLNNWHQKFKWPRSFTKVGKSGILHVVFLSQKKVQSLSLAENS